MFPRQSVDNRFYSKNVLLLLVLIVLCISKAEASDGKSAGTIPSLDETVRLALEYNSAQTATVKWEEKSKSKSASEIVAAIKQVYYDLQCKKERLKIAEEVKGYFEKAASKAEEKFEEGDTSVSQSSLTKLKLGMAGATGDIIALSSEIHIAKLTLGKMIGREFASDSDIADDKISPIEFKYDEFDDYLKSLSSAETKGNKKSVGPEKDFSLHKAFIKVKENREKMNLAEKQKKMTRALLVTESSNYDFGIGNSGDLFEALIIYTRVLSGYYETIYNFNLAVVELNQIATKIPSLS